MESFLYSVNPAGHEDQSVWDNALAHVHPHHNSAFLRCSRCLQALGEVAAEDFKLLLLTWASSMLLCSRACVRVRGILYL